MLNTFRLWGKKLWNSYFFLIIVYFLQLTFLQVFYSQIFLLNPERFKDQMLQICSLPHKNLNLFHFIVSAAKKAGISFSLALLIYHDKTFWYKIKENELSSFSNLPFDFITYFSSYDFPFIFRILHEFFPTLLNWTFPSLLYLEWRNCRNTVKVVVQKIPCP